MVQSTIDNMRIQRLYNLWPESRFSDSTISGLNLFHISLVVSVLVLVFPHGDGVAQSGVVKIGVWLGRRDEGETQPSDISTLYESSVGLAARKAKTGEDYVHCFD